MCGWQRSIKFSFKYINFENLCGTQVFQISLTYSLSSVVSSFLSRPLEFKFCFKNEKTSTIKFPFSTSSGLYLLYETLINKFLDFTFVLLYFVFAFFFFFFGTLLSSWKKFRCSWFTGGGNLFNSVLRSFLMSWFSTSSVKLWLLWNCVKFWKSIVCSSSFKVFFASNISPLPWTLLILK